VTKRHTLPFVGTSAATTRSARSARSAVEDSQSLFDALDVTNPKHAEFYLPMFGDSPGGTPSVSSAASVADSRSDLDDFSDVSE